MKFIETLDQLNEFFENSWPHGGPESLVDEIETIEVADVVNMCIQDPDKWESIVSEYPYIFNVDVRVAFLPMGSPLDNKFINMIVKQGLTNWKFVKTLPTNNHERPYRVTVVTDPLIRFCIAFRYTDNNIWYNQTGHPRGFFMSGTRVAKEALYKESWHFKNQIDIINEKHVDIAIPYDVLYNFSMTFDIQDHKVSILIDQLLKCVVHPDDLLEPPWEWGHQYNMFVKRHQYLEESIHYNIIKTPELKELVYDKFHKDYKAFTCFYNHDGSVKSFNIRYDHYWQNMMNGKI